MMNPIGPINALYPMPTTLVGATVNGKPNFLTVAHVGILNHGTPQYLSIGLGKAHSSNAGIHENRTFSICLPSEEMMAETDYCGIVSGKNTDKAALFTTFYGGLKTAPMIEECPITMECRLIKTVDFPKHDIFMGEVVETYCDEEYLTDGIPDMSKVRPILFIMHDTGYWKIGEKFAKAWNVGKELKDK